MTKAKAILKESIAFSGSTYFSYVFKLINSIVTRWFLLPVAMGLVSEIFLINEYAKAHHLGVLNALDREIPYYRGKGDPERINVVKQTAFNFCLLSAFLVSLALYTSAFYLYINSGPNDIAAGFILVAVLLIAEMIPGYYRILLRTNNRFIFLSKFNIAASITQTVFTIFFVARYDYKGVFLALILTAVLSLVFLFTRSGEKVEFSTTIDFKEVIRLLKIGFPMFLYDIVRTFFLTIDRVIILFLLGRKALGLYSIGTLAYNFLTPLPRGVYNVIFPKFYEAYGRTEDIQTVKHYLVKPTMVFAYLFPLFAGAGAIFLPLVINYFLPHYLDGLMPAFILILSTLFYSLIFMWGYFLIAVRKQNKMILFNLIAIVLNASFSMIFVKICKMGLNGVALSTMLSHSILSVIIICYVFSFYTKCLKDHFLLLLKLYFPMLWVMLILCFMKYYYFYPLVSLPGDILRAFSMICLLLALHIPLIYFLNKETSVVATAFSLVRNVIIKNA